MTALIEGQLQGLLDKQEITEVLYRYARACDRADEELMRGCFHPGALHRHGSFNGTSVDFVTFAMKIISASRMTKHLITNVLIDVSGDSACSESHYFAYHRIPRQEAGQDQDNFSGGRYVDRFERRQGVWRIIERVGLLDFERFDNAADHGFYGQPAEQRSQRYPADELFARFRYAATLPGGR
jgi:3-phenylpropionate/cinnamic acid dioxygenase small subunit